MRLIPLSDYNEQTMQLAKPIYDSHKRVLLAAKSKIHHKLQIRLQQLGIAHIIVEDAESEGITLEEMLDMPTWLDVIQIVKSGYEAAAGKKPLPLKLILQGVDKLIHEVKSRAILVPIPSSAIVEDLRMYAHAVNVALLALQTAKKLGYHEIQLRDVALGALLHDIGKVLTNDYNSHPEAGFQYLRTIREMNLLASHMAFQHHETLSGKGFPRGISGNEVHEYAQICGLANLYDNLLTKQNVFPHDAAEAIMALSDKAYSQTVIQAFVNGVPPYPPGTKVVLSNHEQAIVTRITSNMQRPYVRYLASGEELSLAEHPTLLVTGIQE